MRGSSASARDPAFTPTTCSEGPGILLSLLSAAEWLEQETTGRMGLFDFLGKKKQDDAGTPAKKVAAKDIPRLARLVGDKMAQNYDRQEAIEELAKAGTAEAAEALLKRFSFTMEPSITDQEEKENAAEGIVNAG